MNVTKSEGSALHLSDSLRIQPVMDASGAICEMALVGDSLKRLSNDHTHGVSAVALREAGRVFQASGCLAPLTMDHQLDVHTDIGLPEQLCQDLRIAAVGVDLLPATSPEHDAATPIYPSAKVIYNVPLSDRLVDGADVFRHYREFKPALRIRLLPSTLDGAPTRLGTIRAVGVRVDIPTGISQAHTLQERFFSLLGQASRKGLRVLAGNIKDIDDFNWLRMQPDVLFQGEVLSIALSLEYIREWLTGAGSGWRTFQLGE
ncbi:hypothetical protein ACFWP0_03790 [Achromobacter sp. NPDC058515]|uniref:hypothetical protein n=1 Tax=Achromobacter sp. NPDC058515 TaxID=3346533 RepID=UPI0036679E9C